MAKYADKWKNTFPESIGNQTRPSDGVDNTQVYNTDALPQYMANDPVRYDLQNAINSQLVSNDERLNEKIGRTSDDLAAHNKDPKAHATGISGNAATATKLQTARTLALTGKAAGSTTFDGSANASINVTSVNADTTSKLSTARKINITGDAMGEATFDGSTDITIDTTVAEAAHADKATNDGAGEEIATKYVSGVAVNNATLTVTKGDNTTTELTLPSYSHPDSGISAGLDSYTGITFDEQGHATATTYPTRLTAYNKVNSNVDFEVHYAEESKGLQSGGYYLDGAALPDNGNWIKILTSLDNFDTGHSLGGNGYQKFRSGLILQWGYVGSARSHQFVTCSYPIGFNNVLAVFCTMIGQCTDGGDNGALNLNWYNKNQANFYNTDDRNGTGFFWFAIGN